MHVATAIIITIIVVLAGLWPALADELRCPGCGLDGRLGQTQGRPGRLGSRSGPQNVRGVVGRLQVRLGKQSWPLLQSPGCAR